MVVHLILQSVKFMGPYLVILTAHTYKNFLFSASPLSLPISALLYFVAQDV